MPGRPNPQPLTLQDIAERCARETERFRRGVEYDPGYCFELFRRAIVQRDQRAWALTYAQYRPLATRWVERHPAFSTCNEEVHYFVNRAFERFWRAVTPLKFGRFPQLRSVLHYLRMCVNSVVLDHARMPDHRAMGSLEEELTAATEGTSSVEARALDWMQRQEHRREFWERINAQLQDERERRVLYDSFFRDLKPRELCVKYQDLFSDVQEVYRVKRNILDRLRRDAEFRKLVFPDT